MVSEPGWDQEHRQRTNRQTHERHEEGVSDDLAEAHPRDREDRDGEERLDQVAATLSGGEQQMLATARALCLRPKVLLLDEPTEGLQPSMIDQIRKVVVQMKAEGYAIILVEQRIDSVLSIADRITFVENGRDRETITPSDVDGNASVLKKYLGV